MTGREWLLPMRRSRPGSGLGYYGFTVLALQAAFASALLNKTYIPSPIPLTRLLYERAHAKRWALLLSHVSAT